MVSITFIVLISLFGAWAIFIVTFFNRLIFKSLKYTEVLDPNIEEKYKPFQRFDRSRWNLFEIYFGAIFLLPIRLTIIISYLTFLVILLQILSAGYNPSKEHPLWKKKTINFFIKFGSRLFLFTAGYWYIKKIYKKITDIDPTYPEQQYQSRKKEIAPIIVSNHISWVDSIYHCSDACPSFLAKAEVAKIPFIGKCAQALQCIFVERENSENRNQVKNQMIEREKFIKQGLNFNPILIFPEGTTSNGKYLISFKKGAFEGIQPIRIFCLQYPIRNFNVSLDSVGQAACILLTYTQLINQMTVIEFENFYPDHLGLNQDNENDWIIYAQKIKQIMIKTLGIENSESGYRDMSYYYNCIRGNNKKNR